MYFNLLRFGSNNITADHYLTILLQHSHFKLVEEYTNLLVRLQYFYIAIILRLGFKSKRPCAKLENGKSLKYQK